MSIKKLCIALILSSFIYNQAYAATPTTEDLKKELDKLNDRLQKLDYKENYGRAEEALERAQAVGLGSLAVGLASESAGRNSVAVGSGTIARQDYSIAIGYRAETTPVQWLDYHDGESQSNIAIGHGSNALGSENISIGGNAQSRGRGAYAIGNTTIADGWYSLALGHTAEAHGKSSTSIGWSSIANGEYSFSAGSGAVANGENSIVLGSLSKAEGDNGIAIGTETVANTNSVVIGNHASAIEDGVALGNGSKAITTKGVVGYDISNTSVDKNKKLILSEDDGERLEKINNEIVEKEKESADPNSLYYKYKTSESELKTLKNNEREVKEKIGENELKLKYLEKMLPVWEKEYKRLNNLDTRTTAESIVRNTLEKRISERKKDSENLKINNILNRDKLRKIEREIEEKENFLNPNKEKFKAHEDEIAKLKKEKRKLISTWISTANAVSVGDEEQGITRQITNVAAGSKDTDAVNVAQLKNTGFNLKTSAVDSGERLNGEIEKDKTEFIKAGNTVEMIAGKNMSVKQDSQGKVTYATKDDVNFNSVQFGGNTGPKLTKDGNDLKVSGSNGTDPVKITNVADGNINANSKDAVNGSQLHATNQSINRLGDTVNNIGGNITRLIDKVDNMDRDYRAGIAGSNAAAGLPQAYLPGKSMVAAAAGTFKGQNALAVGYSSISDNGKLIWKAQANLNSRADVGASVGVGYLW